MGSAYLNVEHLPDRSRQRLDRCPDLAEGAQRPTRLLAFVVFSRDEDAFLDARACDGVRRAEEERGEEGQDLPDRLSIAGTAAPRPGQQYTLSCSSPRSPRVHQTRSIPPIQYPKTAEKGDD